MHSQFATEFTNPMVTKYHGVGTIIDKETKYADTNTSTSRKNHNTKAMLIMCMPQLVILTISYNIYNSSYTVAKTSIGVKSVATIVTKQNQRITQEF